MGAATRRIGGAFEGADASDRLPVLPLLLAGCCTGKAATWSALEP